MNDLLKRIQQIEANINEENALLKEGYFLLKRNREWSKLIPFILIGSFILGFFLAQKRVLIHVIPSIGIASLIIIHLYHKMKMLLLIPN